MSNTGSASHLPDDASARLAEQAVVPPEPGATARDLTPVRLSDDRRSLVLVDAQGAEFSVPIGSRLVGVLEGAAAAAGPAEGAQPPQSRTHVAQRAETKVEKMESALRPRDIQHRIRAGESPESVAEAAGQPVERIMNYAAPVLAERDYVARSARTASVRRQSIEPSSSTRTLGAAADERLAQAELDPDTDAEWDAWRRPDGRWALVVSYQHEGAERRATFTLDQPGRFVVAVDDEARWLVGDGRFTTLARVEESLIGEDAIELVNETDAGWLAHQPQRPPAPSAPVDQTMAAEGPGEEETVPVDLDLEHPDGPARGGRVDDADTELPFDLPVDPAAPVDDESAHSGATHASDESEAGETQGPRRPGRRKGRSSVPSWDEIMFGGPDGPA